tara:strand:+ start:1441 stop:2211 length:771 start_codon:yes stop_codon:yes gene_type:complete
MKIFFHHITGKMTDMSLIYCNVYAQIEPHEETEALEGGWAIDEWTQKNPRYWFQGRQTRIDVSTLKYNKKTRKILDRCTGVEHKVKKYSDTDIDEIQGVYEKYMAHRGFVDDLGEGGPAHQIELDPENKLVFHYYHEGVLRAYTLVRTYDNSPSITGLQFCWDYHNPKMSLGKFSVVKEIEWAKENKMKYLYMMAGYEDTCIYKRDYTGFEFWDGIKWSKDKKMYEHMCRRDSQIETFDDMNRLMWEYEKGYFKND